MDLLSFAKAHGILIDSMPPLGMWRRYPTEDHPRKRNGAIKFMGTHAFLQNWATSLEVVVWRSEGENSQQYKARIDDQARQVLLNQRRAAEKAAWIIRQCKEKQHPYLHRKGFDSTGLVWARDEENLLVIPMFDAGELVGCQMIHEDGTKKFLFGQRTSMAQFIFDSKGPNILCEGYATALSIQAVLRAYKRPYTLRVCFSAGNLAKVAQTVSRGLVVADNDESRTGERVALQTGWPWCMPPTVGEDFNDWHKKNRHEAGLWLIGNLTKSQVRQRA